MHFQDGMVWEFGAAAALSLKAAQVPVALVTRIVNSYGHEINIEYYPGSSKLKQITDALGRIVYFNLDGNGNLDSITVPHCNTTVTYDYSVEHPGWGDSAYTKLTEMHPPVLNPVSYTYDANTKELIQVNASYGGTITYNFADQDFAYFDDTMHTRALSSKTLQFASGNSSTWNYVYGDFSGTYPLIYQNLSTGESVELNGGFAIVYGPETIEKVWFFGPQSDSAYGWMSGLLAYKETFKKDGSVSIAQEQRVKEPEPISSEIIYVRGRSWGAATAALEIGGFQKKIGTASQYVQYQYSGKARKYGLFSIRNIVAPYDAGSAAGALKKTPTSGKDASKPLYFFSGGKRGKTASNEVASTTTFYPRFRTQLHYAFENNPDFESRDMLSLVSQETHVDQDENIYKNSLSEYFDSGAIKKITRWKQGGVTLEWNYTYEESPTEGPKEITITIDPPGAAGIETTVYRNGTLARKEKPDFVEYERTVFPDGLIQTETNQHGGVMTFAYDDAGRITSIAMPAGFNPVSASWSQNSVAITRGGNTLTKHWDGMGRNLGFEETGTGMPTLYSRKTLDGEGRVISESKGAINNAHRTVYSLNENGQPLQVTDPTGKWTKFAYADNTCVITDMKGNQKTLIYEYLPGLVTRVEQENTEADSFYKGENRLFVVEITAPGEEKRTQVYYQNGLDQLVQEQHPETGTINYEYNEEGNLSSKSWGGAVISYAYNESNQLASESDGEEMVSFIYDDHGRVREVNSSTESWRRFDIAYNALGAVTSEKQSIDGLGSEKTIEYGYDANGLLSSITYPDGRVASYGNNALMLPVSLAFNSEANRVSGAAYGVNKQPLEYNFGNGTAFLAEYDHAGRVVSSGLGFGGTTLFSATYGYDEVGNIANLMNTVPAANASFQYDAFNRLTKATYPGKLYDYAYDPFGNMLTAKESGLTVFNKSYSPANRISDFSYDSRGNQTGGNGFTQVWDKRNRLVESRTTANILLGSYVYNERGLRIKAERMSQPMVQVVEPNGGESLHLGAMNTVSWSGLGLAGGTVKLELLVDGMVAGTIAENLPGTQTSFQWQAGKMLGGWATIGANYKVRVTAMAPPAASGTTYYFYDSGGRLLSEYDGTGTCVKDYLYLGGKMIGEFVPSTGSYYYYASDQINSTRLVTDATGAVVHSAQYDPYGGLYKTWVDVYRPKPGFSGKEREFGSEMDYFGARYYGHGEYRFVSVDPKIGKDEAITNPLLWNLYAYCRNNPISYIDPDGDTDITILLGFHANDMGGRWADVNKMQINNLSKLAVAKGNRLFLKQLTRTSLDQALGINGGWTFVVSHSGLLPGMHRRSIIRMSNGEDVFVYFQTKNKNVGLFTCSSSDFSGSILGNATVFSVDSGDSGRTKAYGLWLGAIGVIDALLRGYDPKDAAKNGSIQLQLGKEDKKDGDHVIVSNR